MDTASKDTANAPPIDNITNAITSSSTIETCLRPTQAAVPREIEYSSNLDSVSVHESEADVNAGLPTTVPNLNNKLLGTAGHVQKYHFEDQQYNLSPGILAHAGRSTTNPRLYGKNTFLMICLGNGKRKDGQYRSMNIRLMRCKKSRGHLKKLLCFHIIHWAATRPVLLRAGTIVFQGTLEDSLCIYI
jgi:hypothetical protein